MPLIYNSLECDHPPVQEKALHAIPALCDALPYDVLEQVLLVKVAVRPVCLWGKGGGHTEANTLWGWADPVHKDEDIERQSMHVVVFSRHGSYPHAGTRARSYRWDKGTS